MSVDTEHYTEHDWFNEGRNMEYQKRYEDAINAYDESIKINKNYVKAIYYKAQVLYKIGRKDEALGCAKRVVELNPSWEKHLKNILG